MNDTTITFTADPAQARAHGITPPTAAEKTPRPGALYLQALRSFLRTFALLRHLFRRHPNLTWLAITIALCAWLGLKVGQARSERDRYSATNAQLLQRLDSIANNQTPKQ